MMDLCFFFRLLALFLSSSPLHLFSIHLLRFDTLAFARHFVHKGRVSALVSVHITLFFFFFFSGVFWCFSGGFLGGYVPRRGFSFSFFSFLILCMMDNRSYDACVCVHGNQKKNLLEKERN